MISKSELRATIEEVFDEELDGTLAASKVRADLAEALIDRIACNFEVLDDEDEEATEGAEETPE